MKTQTIILAIAALLFSSCATNTGNPSKDRAGRVTNAALTIAGKALASSLWQSIATGNEGQKLDLAQSASEGLWRAGAEVVTSDNLKTLVNAWSGGKIPAVATTAATQFAKLNPQTTAERIAVVNEFARVISATAIEAGLP